MRAFPRRFRSATVCRCPPRRSTDGAGNALYAVGALAGTVLGTAIGQRWMSQQATRVVLVVIFLFAGLRFLLR